MKEKSAAPEKNGEAAAAFFLSDSLCRDFVNLCRERENQIFLLYEFENNDIITP